MLTSEARLAAARLVQFGLPSPDAPAVTSHAADRKRTAYRDAFQQNLYHTWKEMSRQTLVIRRGPGSPAVTQGGESQWAVVTYVPYDPSFETPDEGGVGPSGRPTGASFLREQPSRVLVTDPHLLKTVSKGSVDVTANGAQRTFRL